MSFFIELIILIVIICLFIFVSIWGLFTVMTQPVGFYYDEYGIFTPKPARVKDGKLLLYSNMLRRGNPKYEVIIEDAPHYPFRSALGNLKPCYFVHYHHLKPLMINEDVNKFDFMTLKTLKKVLDNRGIENLAKAIEKEKNPLFGIVIILVGMIVLMAIAYMLFVAPSNMSVETCNAVLDNMNASMVQ